MKKFFAVCGGSLLTILLLAVVVCAQEVKTSYFTLDLPADWMPLDWMSPKVKPRSGHPAFINMKDKTSVSITAGPATVPIKDMVTKAVSWWKKLGMDNITEKQVGESCVVEFTKGELRGVQYVTSNGEDFSMVSIIGKTLDTGKELLQKRFKPVDPKLFPASLQPAVAMCVEEVKTDYFTLDLPADWKILRKGKRLANGNTEVRVQHKQHGAVVNIAVISSATTSIKDMATQTLNNRKADCLVKFAEMKKVGESYTVEYSTDLLKGIHYFTSNGKQSSAVEFCSLSLDIGKEFLQKQLKPVDPKLFPASY